MVSPQKGKVAIANRMAFSLTHKNETGRVVEAKGRENVTRHPSPVTRHPSPVAELHEPPWLAVLIGLSVCLTSCGAPSSATNDTGGMSGCTTSYVTGVRNDRMTLTSPRGSITVETVASMTRSMRFEVESREVLRFDVVPLEGAGDRVRIEVAARPPIRGFSRGVFVSDGTLLRGTFDGREIVPRPLGDRAPALAFADSAPMPTIEIPEATRTALSELAALAASHGLACGAAANQSGAGLNSQSDVAYQGLLGFVDNNPGGQNCGGCKGACWDGLGKCGAEVAGACTGCWGFVICPPCAIICSVACIAAGIVWCARQKDDCMNACGAGACCPVNCGNGACCSQNEQCVNPGNSNLCCPLGTALCPNGAPRQCCNVGDTCLVAPADLTKACCSHDSSVCSVPPGNRQACCSKGDTCANTTHACCAPAAAWPMMNSPCGSAGCCDRVTLMCDNGGPPNTPCCPPDQACGGVTGQCCEFGTACAHQASGDVCCPLAQICIDQKLCCPAATRCVKPANGVDQCCPLDQACGTTECCVSGSPCTLVGDSAAMTCCGAHPGDMLCTMPGFASVCCHAPKHCGVQGNQLACLN